MARIVPSMKGRFFSDFSVSLLFLSDSFNCSNLSNFSKLDSYRSFYCWFISVYVHDIALENGRWSGTVCVFHCGDSWRQIPTIRSFLLVLSKICHSPFFFRNRKSVGENIVWDRKPRNGHNREFTTPVLITPAFILAR